MYGGTRLRIFLRRARAVLQIIWGFKYDCCRFLRFSSWNATSQRNNARNYFLAKIYHRLEKSLSFQERKSYSGWRDFQLVFDILDSIPNGTPLNFHDQRAIETLLVFMEKNGQEMPDYCMKIRESLKSKFSNVIQMEDLNTGSDAMTRHAMEEGKLGKPENFFYSRRSLREFDSDPVEIQVVDRAIRLAQRSPSVCNRQAWHVYELRDPKTIKLALSYQNGNRGFGEKVPNLLVVSADLTAFDAGEERYQPWIDGGIFSMGLVMALHSLGVASCCLNWSCTANTDRRFRAAVPIENEHSIIMMIAFGYPAESNKVCISPRVLTEDITTRM